MLCGLKTLLPNLEFCHYYSDGSPSQYKSYKNFANLLYHEKYHGIPAEWYFFATSHSKSLCDGTGGTTKRLVSHTSLQMNQILNINEMFDFVQRKNNWNSILEKYSKSDYETYCLIQLRLKV